MSEIKVSSVDKLGLVELKRIDSAIGKPIVSTASASTFHAGRRVVKTLLSTVTVSTTALNGTSYFPFIIDNNIMGIMRDGIFRFRISVASSSARIVPTPCWFDRVEIIYRLKNQEIQRVYSDTILAKLSMSDNGVIEALADQLNYNPKTMWVSSRTQSAGESRYYYLPIWLFYQTGLHLDNSIDIANQFEFRFYPRGDIRYSGSGTISLDEMTLMVDSDIVLTDDVKDQINVMSTYVQSQNFLNVQQVVFPSASYSASTTYTWNLDSLKQKSAALLFFLISNNTSNTGMAANKYISLDGAGASDGVIDLLNPTSKSLYGDGVGIPCSYARYILASKFYGSQYLRNYPVYSLVFANDLVKSLSLGVTDDWMQFDGSTYRLQIQTPSAGTAEVQTVTLSGTSASGFYKLGWSSRNTGQTAWTADLAFNTTAANMKTAFEALEPVIQDKIQVTFSAAVSAGTSFTATFTDINGGNVDLKGNLLLFDSNSLQTSAPAAVGATAIARTTPGVNGFIAGTYSLVVYSLYLRQIRKSEKLLVADDL